MMRLIISILLLIAGISTVADTIFDYYKGKSGHELKNAISVYNRPSILLPNNAIDAEVENLCGNGIGNCVEYIVPIQWWQNTVNYKDTIKRNLFNLTLMPLVVEKQRGQSPMGDITKKVVVDADGWAMGHSELYGITAAFVEPPDHLKGDIARSIFYMATLYPSTFWGNYAMAVFDDGVYPTLSSYGQSLYMKWHHADPVDEIERQRVKTIAQIQGASNPFVEYPLLADYLWGIYRDKPYGGETGNQGDNGNNGDNSDNENTDNSPLRSTYTFADKRINLYHPAVPENSQWSVNGKSVQENFLLTEEIGRGIHQLTFKAENGKRGMVKIIVK